MKSKKSLFFLLFGFIALIAAMYYRYVELEGTYRSTSQYSKASSPSSPSLDLTGVDPTSGPVKTSPELDPEGKLEQKSSQIRTYVIDVKKRGLECEQWGQKLLPSGKYIDPEDKIFSQTGAIHHLLKEVWSKTLSRGPYIQMVQAALNSGLEHKDELRLLHEQWDQFDICRSTAALNFLVTLIEASSSHRWSKDDIQEFRDTMMRHIIEELELAPTYEQMSFTRHVVDVMEAHDWYDSIDTDHYRVLLEKVEAQNDIYHKTPYSPEFFHENLTYMRDYAIELKQILSSWSSL